MNIAQTSNDDDTTTNEQMAEQIERSDNVKIEQPYKENEDYIVHNNGIKIRKFDGFEMNDIQIGLNISKEELQKRLVEKSKLFEKIGFTQTSWILSQEINDSYIDLVEVMKNNMALKVYQNALKKLKMLRVCTLNEFEMFSDHINKFDLVKKQ